MDAVLLLLSALGALIAMRWVAHGQGDRGPLAWESRPTDPTPRDAPTPKRLRR